MDGSVAEWQEFLPLLHLDEKCCNCVQNEIVFDSGESHRGSLSLVIT